MCSYTVLEVGPTSRLDQDRCWRGGERRIWRRWKIFFVGGGGASGAEVDVIVDPAVREDEGGVGIR
jgi:hypothetical protein